MIKKYNFYNDKPSDRTIIIYNEMTNDRQSDKTLSLSIIDRYQSLSIAVYLW